MEPRRTPPAIPSRQIDLHSLSSSDVDDKYKNNEESSSGHGRGQVRSIVWAPGTSKVLGNSGLTKELHLITLAADGGIEGAALSRAIAGADSKYMVFEDEMDAVGAMDAMDEMDEMDETPKSWRHLTQQLQNQRCPTRPRTMTPRRWP